MKSNTWMKKLSKLLLLRGSHALQKGLFIQINSRFTGLHGGADSTLEEHILLQLLQQQNKHGMIWPNLLNHATGIFVENTLMGYTVELSMGHIYRVYGSVRKSWVNLSNRRNSIVVKLFDCVRIYAQNMNSLMLIKIIIWNLSKFWYYGHDNW